MCKGKESYTGKTVSLRARTNNHISACRNGTGTNMFDIHVHNCGKTNNCLKAPFFKLFAFMTVASESKLLPTERYLHAKEYDTMNR